MAVAYKILKDFTERDRRGRKVGPARCVGDAPVELPSHEVARLAMAGCIEPIESAAYAGAPEKKRRGRPRRG